VDLLGKGADLRGQRVNLFGEVGVLRQQTALELGELIAVFCRGFLVCLVGPGLRLLGDDDKRARVERDTS
jgi:hypothetical protein